MTTNLYIKPTNKQLYLDSSSNHPEHCKIAIPYSQALRAVEKCSEEEDRETHFTQLKERFKIRNYPEKVITEKFEKAKKHDRRSLIFKNRTNRNGEAKKVRFIFTHIESNPPIHKWVRMCKPLLERNAVSKETTQKFTSNFGWVQRKKGVPKCSCRCWVFKV